MVSSPIQDRTPPASGVVAQTVLSQAAQAPVSVPSPQSPSSSKEAKVLSSESPLYIETVGAEAIEKEPIPEEVEQYIEKVETNVEAPPPEIVVADKTAVQPTGTYAAQPVFVLPLGEVEMKQGFHKGIHESIRWLSTWCKRVMKIFKGRVVYRESV